MILMPMVACGSLIMAFMPMAPANAAAGPDQD